ncbi:MAG TPA: sulfotransferase [Sphingomicrobium sp.]|nr:sulfotransferase [Sphingomicrobium sp.]
MGLADGGDPASLHALLGMLRCRSGDMDRGIGHLRAAHRARPADPVIAGNLASALAELGKFKEALDVVSADLARSDRTFKLLKLRGFLAQSSEEFAVAIDAYEQVVAAAPADWESWNNLGNSRNAAGDLEGSIEALRRAADLNPVSAPIRINLATALAAAASFDEAEAQLRKMAEDFPADAKPMRELHGFLKQQARDEEALDAIEEAVARAPADLELRLALASHRLSLLQHSASEEAYSEVVRRDPGNSLANIGLAVVLELTNRSEDLSSLVSDAAARGVADDAMNFIRAFDHRRAKRFQEGLASLSRVPEELETARRFHLLGQLEDGAGNYDQAFVAFERMNEIQRADPSQPEERGARYRSNIQQQLDLMTGEWAAPWIKVPIDDRPSPAFLVGFPRSGTTLLDTILMGHPKVEVLEEEPPLRHAQAALQDFANLPRAEEQDVKAARDLYFESAGKLTPLAPGNLLVDKNPLAMNGVPLIQRMFPDARIILALRHPCDVVLSCFVTNFKLNDGMVNFMRLETAAELYDLSFRYFERACELLRPEVYTIRYENLVEDRDRELRPLFNFLDLEWADDVLDHQATARGRSHIKTASYAQVVQPIYKQSAGRWQNYRKHLEPIIPLLRPWIEKFGYEA